MARSRDVPTMFDPTTFDDKQHQQTTRIPDPKVVNDMTARRIHALTREYPWLKGDQALGLAQTVWGVHSRQMADLAKLAGDSKKKRGFNWLSPGDWVDKGAAVARSEREGFTRLGKAVPRVAFTALQTGGEMLSHTARVHARAQADLRAQGVTSGAPVDSDLARAEQVRAQQAFTGEGDGVHFGAPQINPLHGTTLGVVVDKLRNGERVDLGEGFFPGGDVATEQRQRAADEAYINDPKAEGGKSAATAGRIIAVGVTEPGTTQYRLLSGLVDAGAQWWGDPSNAALGYVSEARAASRTFSATRVLESTDAARGVEETDDILRMAAHTRDPEANIANAATGIIGGGPRKSIIPVHAEQWLDGGGRRVVEGIAGESNARTIFEKLGQGVTPEQAMQLAEAKTPQEVRGILGPMLGLEVRQKPTLGFTSALSDMTRRTKDSVRILGVVPGAKLDLNDPIEVARGVKDVLVNAKMPSTVMDDMFNRVARATTNQGRKEAVFDTIGAVQRKLLGDGVDERVAQRATRIFHEDDVADSAYFIDSIGNDVRVPGAVVNGDGLPIPHPHLISEFLENTVPLPDARTIRRLTSPYRRLLARVDPETGALLPRVPLMVADTMGQTWRTLTVARPALTLRIFAESQARMGGVGLDSLVSHPIETLAWIVGRKGDALGAEFDAADDFSKFAKSMSARRGRVSEGALARGWGKARRGDVDYAKSLTAELQQLHTDPVARRLAGGFDEGDVVPLSEDLVTLYHGTSRATAERIASEGFKGRPDAFLNPHGDVFLSDSEEFARRYARPNGSAPLRPGEVPFDEPAIVKVVLPRSVVTEHAAHNAARELQASEHLIPVEVANDALRRGAGRGITGNYVDDVKRWWWNGGGKATREQLAEASGDADLLKSRAAGDAYVDSVAERVAVKTSHHADLIDAVRTGEFNGQLIYGAEQGADRDGLLNAFIRHVEELTADTGDAATNVGPAVVKRARMVRSRENHTLFRAMDKAMERFFHVIIGLPLDKTMYSPAFRQLYWRRMAELSQHATPEAKTAILESARQFKISDEIVAAIGRAPGAGSYTVDELHTLANGFAAQESLKLLDDMTSKSQFADIARNFFPFAEAWKDALVEWSRIVATNPRVVRRFQQTVNGARGSGFFAPDPDTGEETFTFPLSAQITRSVLGVEVPLTGRVGGLNIFSDSPLMPGFGPVVQLPVNAFLPDKPDYDGVRNLVMPYGSESLGGTFVPSWASKAWAAMKGDEGDRLFANSMKDVMAYLYSTGDYDISTTQGMNRLKSAARTKARGLMALRALAQVMGPTSASPNFKAETKNGDAFTFVLADRLREMYAEDERARRRHKTVDTPADERFLQEFGPKVLLYLQSKTQRTGTGPLSKAGYDWVRDNEGVVRDYDDVYGFFAPQGDDFNFDAYNRLLSNGELRTLSPKEYLEAANARAANMIYRNARDQLGPRAANSDAGRAALHKLRDRLVDKFPGYSSGVVNTGRRDQQIRQLRLAVNDPRLANNDVAKAVRAYMEVRQAALDKLGKSNLYSLSSKSAAPFAARLREVADHLLETTPEFWDVFDSVFARELGDDNG